MLGMRNGRGQVFVMSELRSKAIGGMGWNAVSTASQTILQVAQFFILARILNPEDYGVAGMAYIMSGFLQVFQDMGFSAVVVQRNDLCQKQLSSLYWLNIMSGCALFLVILALSYPVSAFYAMPSLKGMMICIGVNMFALSFGMQYVWQAEKDLKFAWLSRVDVIVGTVGAITSILLAFLGFKAWSIVLGQTLSGFFRTILLVAGGRKSWKPSRHFAWADLESLRSFGLYQMAERTINYFNTKIDQMVLGKMLGSFELGLYSFGFNLSSRLSDKTNPIVTRVAFPVLAKVQYEKERQKAIYLKIVHALTLVNAPVHLGFALIAPEIVNVFFHAKWMPAVPVLQIIAAVYLMRSIGNPVGTLALSSGRADLTFWWNVIAFGVTPLSVVVGGWFGGLKGVAISLLVTQILYFWPAYRIIIRPVIGKCFMSYLDSAIRPIGVSILTMGATWWLAQGVHGSIARLILMIPLAGVLYSILILFLDRRRVLEAKALLLNRAG